jgi:hypothetical protein
MTERQSTSTAEQISARLTHLYPGLSPEQIDEARENLTRYGHLALRVFLHSLGAERTEPLQESEPS